VLHVRNKRGLTVIERIKKDIEYAEAVKDVEQRQLLAHMAIAAAELAIDFELITQKEWGDITQMAFDAM
jgi:hypothetical protein